MGVLYARVAGEWVPVSASVPNQGVQQVVAGAGIAVNNADPTKPIVSATGPQLSAFSAGQATGPGGTMASGDTIISATIVGHATLARTASVSLVLLCNTDGGGGDIQLIIRGNYSMGWRMPSNGITQCMVTFTRHNITIPVNTSTPISIKWASAGHSLTTYGDGAFNVLSWQTFPA